MSVPGFSSYRLGDLLRIKHGYAFKGQHFTESGDFVLLTPGNFREEGGLKLRGEREKYYGGEFPDEFVLEQGDLLVAMTDLTQEAPILGSAAFVPENNRFLHNQRLGKVTSIRADRILPQYLYYLFNTPSVRSQLRASATGATVRHTSPERIYCVTAALPDLNRQLQIAGFVGGYDAWIDNNLRRIQILEEMLHAVYHEWFVLRRFPGHKSVTGVRDGCAQVPAGWRRTTLGDILELNYGKALKQDERRAGDVPVFGSSGVIGFHDTALTVGPGVIVGRKGNVGSVFWSDDAFFPIDTVFYVTSTMPLRFVYHALKTMTFLNSDAAVPGLNRQQAYSLEILIPPSELVDRFCAVADTMVREAFLLRRVVDNLRRTRDLILPRLMSGRLTLRAAERELAAAV